MSIFKTTVLLDPVAKLTLSGTNGGLAKRPLFTLTEGALYCTLCGLARRPLFGLRKGAD